MATVKQRPISASSRPRLVEACNLAPQVGHTTGRPGYTSVFRTIPGQNGHLSVGHFIFRCPAIAVLIFSLLSQTRAERPETDPGRMP